jgi:hypothetical protein
VPDAGSDGGVLDGGTHDGGSADAGSDAGVPDAGTDGGVLDGGSADAGSGSGPTGLLFSDPFSRTTGDDQALGPNWSIAGLWYANSRAISDLTGTDLATETVVRCGDCQVQADVIGFGVPDTAIFLRETNVNGANRYQLDLKSNGHIQIQRVINSNVTVLADVASGISDLGNWANLALKATGNGPVQLTAYVNGVAKISVTDSSSAALTSAGYAGLYTTYAGVWWDNFRIDGFGASGSEDG